MARPVFVGRDAELAQLERLLVNAADGSARTVLVSGEAGVGKSRLLSEFADRSRTNGGLVLCGWCVALGSGDLPYAPLVDAFRRLVRTLGEQAVREFAGRGYADLAELFAGFQDDSIAPPVQATTQLRVFGAVLRLLERLGADRPVVLILEDLHWADPSSLALLAYLARAHTDERLLVLGSYRSTDLHPRHPLRTLVAELDHARRAHRMELVRFTKGELRAFLAAKLGEDVSHEAVERAFDLSDGNAFFAEELVRTGAMTDPDSLLPQSLRDLVLVRFELLSDDAREVMRVAATAGRQASHRLLAAVCDLTEPRMLVALRESVDAQMLVVDPVDSTYVFRHALLREAVHQDLLPGERLRLHAAMATALAGDSELSYAEGLTVAAELAYHWYEAGQFPEALAASVRAGDTATRVRAFREAELQYLRALDLWDRVEDAAAGTGTSREQLLAAAADAARWSGHVDSAVDLVRQALAEIGAGSVVRSGELYERLGSYLWEAGDSGQAHRAFADAGLLLVEQPESAVRARVLAGLATAEIRMGKYSAAARLGLNAVAMAQKVDAKAEEGRALNTAGVALTMTGRVDEGVSALKTALQIADASDHLEDLFRAYGNLVFALENSGRLEEAVSVALDGLHRAHQFGIEHTRTGAVLANNASAALVQLGRWDEAEAMVTAILVDRPLRETLFPRVTLAEIHVARGRFGEIDHLLGGIRERGRSAPEPQLAGGIQCCEAERAIWLRQHQKARSAVADGIAAIAAAEDVLALLRLYALGLRAEADERSRLAALPGIDPDRITDVQSTVEGLTAGVDASAVQDRPSLPEEAALRALCGVERARCDETARAEQWAGLAVMWEQLGRPYRTAYARWREAESAAAVRDSERATRAARVAHQLADHLGAAPLLAEIEALARQPPLYLYDHRRAEPVSQVEADPFGLTGREREVLRLLCAGYSNRRIAGTLFISDKTASVHVSNILRKLEVPNRGEAAAVAHRLQIFPPDDPVG